MKTNNTPTNVATLLTAAAYVRNETIINGNQAAQLDAMIGQIKDLTTKIEAVPAKIAGFVTQGKEKAVAMWERMAARYQAQFADAVASLRAWLVDFKANRPNVQINLNEPEDPKPTNPDNNTPTTMNASEIIASLNENQVRAAAVRLLPDKLFDEYFTPERGNIALLRQMLEDHVFEYDTTAAEIMEAAGADESANKTKASEFSELSHAGQCLDIYLHNDSFIYEYYTQKAIEAIVNDGLSISSEDVRKYVKGAIYRASWQVEKYDHMTPTAQDVEQVTCNYVAYIANCAK